MKILFIGDIVARSGREAIRDHLPALRDQYAPDLIIANGENSAHGSGHTPKIVRELYDYGVQVITSGNHVWGQKEIIPYLGTDPYLIRPLNFPPGTPGPGHVIYTLTDGRKALVVNAMGRLYMDPLDCPFAALKALVDKTPLGRSVQAIFIDFHAEASSEKQAIAYYMDGRVSAVIGTHTHVPTADTRILPGGTAYQTDAGMTGDYQSILGRDIQAAIHRFTRKMPGPPLSPVEGPGTLCGTFIETDDTTGLARRIERVQAGAGW